MTPLAARSVSQLWILLGTVSPSMLDRLDHFLSLEFSAAADLVTTLGSFAGSGQIFSYFSPGTDSSSDAPLPIRRPREPPSATVITLALDHEELCSSTQ